MEKITGAGWRELQTQLEDFFEIVRMLLKYDEQTGRASRLEPHLHLLRKAVSQAPQSEVRVFLRDLGGWVYHVVVEWRCPIVQMTTTWVHEDGIRREREELFENTEHPVHGIVCVTDLFERACEIDLSGSGNVASSTLELIHESSAEVAESRAQ